jgi:hypothetical protein
VWREFFGFLVELMFHHRTAFDVPLKVIDKGGSYLWFDPSRQKNTGG